MLPDLTLPDLPYIAGVALRSADLAATRRVLMREAIKTPIATDEAICVGPADALGAYLLFHAEALDAPWRTLAQSRGG